MRTPISPSISWGIMVTLLSLLPRMQSYVCPALVRRALVSAGGNWAPFQTAFVTARSSRTDASMTRCFATNIKAPLDFSQHTMNLANALKKPVEGHSLSELVLEDVSVIQGIGPVHSECLSSLGIQTVHDLARWKFFHAARSITVLADMEDDGDRVAHSSMNINDILDKAYQTKSLKEIADSPVAALFGISDEKGDLLKHNFGCRTIRDLSRMKCCLWAEAMVQLEPFEASTEEDPES